MSKQEIDKSYHPDTEFMLDDICKIDPLKYIDMIEAKLGELPQKTTRTNDRRRGLKPQRETKYIYIHSEKTTIFQ